MEKPPKTEKNPFKEAVSSKKLKRNICIVALLIVVLSVSIVLGKSYLDNRNDQEVSQKLESLNRKDTTCEEVLSAVGDVSVDQAQKFETKRTLLERQMLCFADNLEFNQAINAAEELKLLYESQSDTKNEERIKLKIEDLKNTQSQFGAQEDS